jgi:prevent-host-death family protein
MFVAIRELKARLSDYLEQVAGGETILVTNRGRVVAQVVPPPRAGAVEQGLAEGWITRQEHRAPAAFEPESSTGHLTSTDTLREDRDS